MKTLTHTAAALTVASASLLAIAGSVNAQPVAPYPLYPFPSGSYGVPLTTGEELFASGGDVTVTYLGWQGAGYNEYLFVKTPSNPLGQVIADDFFENHTTPAGTSINLGSYAAGTEIEFGIYILDTGNTWYDGPGSRNADGAVHAYVKNDYEGQSDLTYVGFEDEVYPGGDFNYLDEVYTFQGASGHAVPDMPGTLPLLGLGLSGLAALGRRFRK
jgi:hypothetical protein